MLLRATLIAAAIATAAMGSASPANALPALTGADPWRCNGSAALIAKDAVDAIVFHMTHLLTRERRDRTDECPTVVRVRYVPSMTEASSRTVLISRIAPSATGTVILAKRTRKARGAKSARAASNGQLVVDGRQMNPPGLSQFFRYETGPAGPTGAEESPRRPVANVASELSSQYWCF
jgi:hypothetical protein